MARASSEVSRYIPMMKHGLSFIVVALFSATLHAAPQVLDIDWKDSARERT